MTESALLVASHQREEDAAAMAASVPAPRKKQSPTDMHVDRGNASSCSPLRQSRVGRDKQRYDGRTRLLACVVATRPASAAAGSREVLLISSAKHADEWILPKGGWESDESVVECALREAEEEAGVSGSIVAELGPLDFVSHRGQPCRFFGFTMAVARVYSDWSENSRQRLWVPVDEAKRLLRQRPELLEMLTRAM